MRLDYQFPVFESGISVVLCKWINLFCPVFGRVNPETRRHLK